MSDLGIYESRASLDHDTEMLIDEALHTLIGRGVEYEIALASIRRVAGRISW